MRRFTANKIEPVLAKALLPLEPTVEELQDQLDHLRRVRYQIRRYVRAERLAARLRLTGDRHLDAFLPEPGQTFPAQAADSPLVNLNELRARRYSWVLPLSIAVVLLGVAIGYGVWALRGSPSRRSASGGTHSVIIRTVLPDAQPTGAEASPASGG